MLPGRLAADNGIQVFSMREMGVQRRGSVFEEPGRFGLRGTRQGTQFLPGTYSGGSVGGLGQRVHFSSCRFPVKGAKSRPGWTGRGARWSLLEESFPWAGQN